MDTLANIGAAKAKVPPGVFFRRINHRSIRRWHPHATLAVEVLRKKPDKDVGPLKTTTATAERPTTSKTKMTSPKRITTIFNQGIPNCIIIISRHRTEGQDAKSPPSPEALATRHIILSQIDSFHGESLIFRLQQTKKPFEGRYKSKMLQHQEETYSSKSVTH